MRIVGAVVGAIVAVVAAGAVGLSSQSTNRVFACTQPPGGPPIVSIADRVAASDVVVHGRVVGITAPQFATYAAVIVVEDYYKGEGASLVAIDRFGPGSLCLSEVQPGMERVFYARRNAEGGLTAYYATQFDAAAPATPDTFAAIMMATGESPRRPEGGSRLVVGGLAGESAGLVELPGTLPVGESLAAEERGRSSVVAASALVVAGGIGMLGVVGARRRR